jgi:hypothetical protein
MAYIGKTPTIGNFQKCDAITVVNGQAAYTMQVGGTNVSPESENHMLVSLNGILQAPVDSFTISGSTITFASNLATGDVIDFIMLLGNVLDLGVPSDNTVSTAKIVDGAITSAKLTAGKVLQVVSTTETSSTTISSEDTITEFINASITPSSTSNKILVTCHGVYGYGVNDAFGHILLFKDGSILSTAIGDTNSSAYRGTTSAQARTAGGATSNVARQFSFQFLDSPATTSSTTYSGRAVATNNTSMYIGRSGTVSDDNRGSYITTLTLMEIAG